MLDVSLFPDARSRFTVFFCSVVELLSGIRYSNSVIELQFGTLPSESTIEGRKDILSSHLASWSVN